MEKVLDGLRHQLGDYMVRRGLNYSELARKSGVKPSFIYDILNGKSLNPSVVKLCKIAEALDIALTELLGGASRPRVATKANVKPKLIPTENDDFVVASWFADSEEQPLPLLSFRRAWLEMAGGVVDVSTLRLYRIQDVSMRPVLMHHDIVLLDLAVDLRRVSGLYLVKQREHCLVRRVEMFERAGQDYFKLMPCHPHYEILEAKCAEVQLVGRIIWRGSFMIE
jgi:transcriptional regulator with XRE-family HTH domain